MLGSVPAVGRTLVSLDREELEALLQDARGGGDARGARTPEGGVRALLAASLTVKSPAAPHKTMQRLGGSGGTGGGNLPPSKPTTPSATSADLLCQNPPSQAKGDIDAVRIYDRALNNGEINALFRVRE